MKLHVRQITNDKKKIKSRTRRQLKSTKMVNELNGSVDRWLLNIIIILLDPVGWLIVNK